MDGTEIDIFIKSKNIGIEDVLVKNGGDPKLSENEIMLDMGYKRIYDCGSMKFEKCLS